jgi:hypothetical protein
MKTSTINDLISTDTTPYIGLCLRSGELSDYMAQNEILFCGRMYSQAAIATMASRCVIPSVQMYIEGKTAIKKPRKIMQTYDVSEISR